MTVYDSLGKDHQLTQYFVKTDDNKWDVHYQLDQVAIDPAAVPRPIEFNKDGTLATGATGSVTFPVTGANDLIIPVNYTDSTQFAGDFGYTFKQDGYATGAYASMSIAADGSIIA